MIGLKLDSKEWYEQVARLVEAAGTSQFPQIILEVLSALVPFDRTIVLRMPEYGPPTFVAANFEGEALRRGEEKYRAGPYLLDPIYTLIKEEKPEAAVYPFTEYLPDGFTESEYYQIYFKELHIIDQVDFVYHIGGGQYINIVLCRQTRSRLVTEKEVETLRLVEPLIRACVKRHWKDAPLSTQDQPEAQASASGVSLHQQLERAFANFGHSLLTKREAEVLQLQLRGHSTKSTAERLGITDGTVKIHRRNVYTKLDISSQSELFYLFLDAMSSVAVSEGEDPLAAYLGVSGNAAASSEEGDEKEAAPHA